MSTYIVEVDSGYRDLNAYPNQCDFAVSFNQNLTTAPQVLGQPYSFSGTVNNFFTKCSIDPDYQDSNLRVIGGNIQRIERSESSFYISGVMFNPLNLFRDPIFSIYDGDTLLFSLVISYEDPRSVPYLCRLDKQVDGSYKLEWIIYANGRTDSFSGDMSFAALPSETRYSTVHISFKGGIFWTFDFNFQYINVKRANGMGNEQELYNITLDKEQDEQWCNIIFAFDTTGNPYFIDNRPWGYHFLKSSFKLQPVNFDGKLGLETNSADDVFCMTNLDPTDLECIPVLPLGYYGDPYDTYLQTSICVYRNTPESPNVEYFISDTSNRYFLSEIRISASLDPDSLTNPQYTAKLLIEELNAYYLDVCIQSYICDLNGFVYYMTCGEDRFGNSPPMLYPYWIYQIDAVAGTMNLIATTPSRFFSSSSTIGCNNGVDKIYLATRDNNAVVYMYEINVITSTVTELVSISLPTTVSIYTMIACDWIDNDNILIISPDSDELLITGNYYERCKTLWFMKYTLSTNTISIINSSFQIYPSIRTIHIDKWKPGFLTFNLNYNFPDNVDLFSIDLSTLEINLYYTFDVKSFVSSPFIYETADISGNIKHLIVLKPDYSDIYLYDISSDVYPPLLLSKEISLAKAYPSSSYVPSVNARAITPFVTPYGYIYHAFFFGWTFKTRFVTYPNTSLTSTHYYQNPSFLLSLEDRLDIIEQFIYNDRTFLIVANQTSMKLYEITNITNLTFISEFAFSSPFSEPLYYLQIQIEYNSNNIPTTKIYVGLMSRTQAYIYYTNTSLAAPVLIANYTYEVDGYAGLNMIYTSRATEPQHYLMTVERGGRMKKFLLNNSNVVLIRSETYPLFVPFDLGRICWYTSTKVYYYPTYSIYTLIAYGNGLIGGYDLGGYSFHVNITNYEDFDLTNTTQPSYLNYGVYEAQVLKNMGNINGESTVTDIAMCYSASQTIFAGGTVSLSVPYYADFGEGFAGSFAEYKAMNYRGYVLSRPISEITSLTGAFTFQSTQWTNPITNQKYVALSVNGNYDDGDSISIIDMTDPGKIIQVGATSINPNGIIQSLTSYTIGARSVLAAIVNAVPTGDNGQSFGPSKIWLYDVSNIQNAVKGTDEYSVTKTYTNFGATIGAGILHKIDSFGNPSWVCYAGGNLEPGCTNNRFQQITFNPNGNVYLAGGWINHTQFFAIENLASGTLSNQPMNDLLLINGKQQGYIAEVDSFEGKWKWVVPIAGIGGDLFVKDLLFSQSLTQLASVCNFSSINAYIYEPQQSQTSPTGFTIGKPQRFFFNSSAANSIVFMLDTSGNFKWRSVLFTKGGSSYTNITNLWVDELNKEEPVVVVSGTNNSTTLSGEDGEGNLIQTLYPQINPLAQSTSIVYTFSLLTGQYRASQYQSLSFDSTNTNSIVRSYSDINLMLVVNAILSYSADLSYLTCYNKDSSFGGKQLLDYNVTSSIVSSYDTNSLYQDTNSFSYSTICVYNFTGPIESVSKSLANSYIFVQGDPEDILINKNFIIRFSEYDKTDNILKIVLNQQILTNRLIRRFSTINNIPESNQYYSSNVSISPLYDVGYYTTDSISGNSITFSTLYNNPPGRFDLTKEYYFIVPQPTISLVPIIDISYNPDQKQYTMTVTDINDLRVPSPSGPFYGPYINIGQKNYSAFYSLQWYPGARLYAQSYLVGLYDLIIPNRPVRNAQFPGVRYITDYPYIYLVIYNANEVDAFDSTVVNSVYDNNVNVPRFALFQLPTTSFTSFGSDSNFISASSTATPRIRFIPGYYKLHFKLTDDIGNVLYFDNAPSKETDSIFADGVVPEKLLKVTARMAFKRG